VRVHCLSCGHAWDLRGTTAAPQCSRCKLHNRLVDEQVFLKAVAKTVVALRFEEDESLNKFSQTLTDARAAFPGVVDRLAGAAALRVTEIALATLLGVKRDANPAG